MQLKRTIKDWVGQIKEVIATFMDCTSMSKQSQKKRFKWETWGIKEDLKKNIHKGNNKITEYRAIF
jgi:hypothetical protein